MATTELARFEERFYEPEAPRSGDVRYPYERDRARIIHSAGFRRLQGKTQVMGVGEGDFHRTRLTHTIEVAQVGTGVLDQFERTLVIPAPLQDWKPSRALTEAACFAHDLGHPPFGHGGERALFYEMRHCGGFEGNAQTLRLLTRLEKYTERGRGINPTRRLVLAVMKYPVRYSKFDHAGRVKPPKCYYDDESDIVQWALQCFDTDDRNRIDEIGSDDKAKHRTFDSSLMEFADDVAYGVHDLEDIINRKLASRDQWETDLTKAFDAIGGHLDTDDGKLTASLVTDGLFADSWTRKRLVGRLVNLFMAAAKIKEFGDFSHPLLRFRVGLEGAHAVLLDKFKNTAFHLAIDKPTVQQLEQRGKRLIIEMFQALREDPKHLIPSWIEGEPTTSTSRRICDYVAGMTDSYAEKVYSRLFIPGIGSSSDYL